MIELAPRQRDILLRDFGCGRRLAARVVALGGKGVGLSAVVVEEARPGSPLEAMLLAPEWMGEGDAATILATLLAAPEHAALAQSLPLTLLARDGEAVLALEEEALAEAAEQQAAPPASPAPAQASPHSGMPAAASDLPVDPSQSAPAPLATRPADAPVQPLSPGAGPSGGEGGAVFSEQEVARLRVQIFAGSSPSERVSALRQFAYADVPEGEKIRVFLAAMAESDRALRAAAATGIRLLGLAPEIADAAETLAEGAPKERLLAAERLTDHVRTASAIGLDGVLMALAGALRDPEADAGLRVAVLKAFESAAPHLGPGRMTQADLLRTLLKQLANAEDTLHYRRVLRAVEGMRAGSVVDQLCATIGETSSVEYRAILLALAIDLAADDERRHALLPPAVDAFCELGLDHASSRALGVFAASFGDAGPRALAERLPTLDAAHQRQILRLVDNAMRVRTPAEPTRVALAEACAELLERARLQVRIDILETHVAIRPDLPAPLRGRVAEAIIRDLNDYAHWPVCDTLENALVHLGGPAIEPIRVALRERVSNRDGAVLANALGRIGLSLGAAEEEATRAQAEGVLRELTKLSFDETRFRDALHLAMGRICSRPALGKGVHDMIVRTLLDRLEGGVEDAAILRALGLCCLSAAMQPARARTVAGLCLAHLRAARPDPEVAVEMVEGEEVFQLGRDADAYVELLPACMDALANAALGPRTPEPVRREIIAALLSHWDEIARFALVWGPQNTALLTEALGRIGAGEEMAPGERIRIATKLATRTRDGAVLEALAGMLARRDRLPQLDRIAGAVVLRLLKRLDSEDEAAPETRENDLRMLARVVGRGRLAGRDPGDDVRLYERAVNALLAGLKQGVGGMAATLRDLVDRRCLPPAEAERVQGELARFTSLATRA